MEAITNFVDYLRYEKRFSEHTIIAYQNDLNQFTTFLAQEGESLKLKEIIAAQIRSWLVKLLEEGIEPRSVNRKITSLKTFFKYALKNQWIESNPMLKVVSPKVAKKLPVYVPAERLDFLLDRAEFAAGFDGQRDHLIIELLYGTGMRRAELLGLGVDDIDFRNKQLKVTGKRNKQRIIPLFDHLLEQLEAYLKEREQINMHGSTVLFLDSKGQALYADKIYRVVRKYLSLISTQTKRSPHVLRHSFATEMLNKGADLNSIKEILGHANLSATQVYTHNSIEKLREVYKKAHPRGE
jgi:integrase/recombinase XerC